MALAETMNGEKLLIQIGDGATTEVFAHPCLVNTDRGIQFSSDTSDNLLVDCLNPSDPAWYEREKDGLSATVNGSGKLHTSSIAMFFNWWKGADPKNVRIKVDVTSAKGGGYWQGAFHCTEFEVSGTRKEKAETSITLISTGPLTWTAATP